MDTFQIVKKPLHTEKSVTDRDRNNSYHFEVDKKANKIQIKEAIEKLFKVKVLDVRTVTRRGKSRRTRYGPTKGHIWKKAVVTLAEGNAIDLGY